jgi:hypothetical protein
MANLHTQLNFMYEINDVYQSFLNACLFIVIENLCLIQPSINTWPLKFFLTHLVLTT